MIIDHNHHNAYDDLTHVGGNLHGVHVILMLIIIVNMILAAMLVNTMVIMIMIKIITMNMIIIPTQVAISLVSMSC